ncbi:S8 family serine peptidase [Cryptosporangium minutisporangium]|uniref:Peptidase S8/S53 domain-containing protein n=1 Tax=Cryptosporangium minutisporangium TaxID=113569 RepID=A0ABP6T4X8_9ACTN
MPAPTTKSRLRLPNASKALLARARRTLEPTDDPASEATRDRMVTAFVEFLEPVDARWSARLHDLGLQIIGYQPENSYLCRGPLSAFHRARTDITTSGNRSAVATVTDLLPEFKPQLESLGEAGNDVVIVVAASAGERAVIAAEIGAVPGVVLLDGAGNDTLDHARIRFRARIQSDSQRALLQHPQVLAVEDFVAPVPEDEQAGLIVAGLYDAAGHPAGSYLRWLRDLDLDGRGALIGIVDSGVDVSHPAFTGRVRDLTGGRKDWHATMVAGHAAGDYRESTDDEGLIYGLGIAPAAQVLSQWKSLSAEELCRQTVGEAAGLFAVQNNSWGKQPADPMSYGSDEALYDALVRNADPAATTPAPLVVCFSAGNSGAAGLTRPKAAKNVLVTGNSESFRPNAGGIQSDDISEVYTGLHGSSHGNCGDGRVRPHVVAPGEWTASANYDCHAGEPEYVNPLITWGGGSSGASPKTAGACALLAQWWLRTHPDRPPSPALLRALIVNGAEPMRGAGSPPNSQQGWGRLNLANILDPAVARVIADEGDRMTLAGQERRWTLRVADPRRPVKVTLAWTDPPGAVGTGASAELSPIVNRLALRVTTNGRRYQGLPDRFREGVTLDDAALATAASKLLPEGADNLQNIVLAPGTVGGELTVTVNALRVVADCRTGRYIEPGQDFALVITNAVVDSAATPTVVAVTADPESFRPADPSAVRHWSADSADGDRVLAEISAGGRDAVSLPPDRLPDDAAWWETETPAATVGADAERDGLAPDALIATATAVTAGALDTAGHRIAIGSTYAAFAPDQAATGLGAAISSLLSAVRSPPCDDVEPPSPAAHACAILLVGSGTRAQVADLHALRTLAAAATLTIVSDDASVLAFLAQRIGPGASAKYRLAAGHNQLPDVLSEAMTDSGGLQRILVSQETTATGTRFSFGVVPADRSIVVRVEGELAERSGTLVLRAADGTEITWPFDAAPQDGADIRVAVRTGAVEFAHLAASGLPGQWELRAEGWEQPVRAQAWAVGGTRLAAGHTPTASGARAETADRTMLRVAGPPGHLLRQLTVEPPRLTGTDTGPRSEYPRATVIRAVPGRLDNSGQTIPEAQRTAAPVPALGQVLPLPGGPTPVVGDLTIHAVGTDSGGHDFDRTVRIDVHRVQPWSDWRAQVAADRKLRYTRGRILALESGRDGVDRVTVARGGRRRVVQVVPEPLRQQLAAAGTAHLAGLDLVLGVTGNELHALYRPLYPDLGHPAAPVFEETHTLAEVPTGAHPTS